MMQIVHGAKNWVNYSYGLEFWKCILRYFTLNFSKWLLCKIRAADKREEQENKSHIEKSKQAETVRL